MKKTLNVSAQLGHRVGHTDKDDRVSFIEEIAPCACQGRIAAAARHVTIEEENSTRQIFDQQPVRNTDHCFPVSASAHSSVQGSRVCVLQYRNKGSRPNRATKTPKEIVRTEITMILVSPMVREREEILRLGKYGVRNSRTTTWLI